MPNLGRGGPPDRVPSTPTVDLSSEELDEGKLQEIGRGASGVVYRVEVQRPQRQFSVAVKKPELSGTISADLFDEFAEEAKVWQNLTDSPEMTDDDYDGIGAHEHIVDVLDWGVDSLPWIAMEYMDQGSLDDLLDGEPLPVDQALWVGESVCRAVWHAHRHGVVHHDLKPSNILLRESSSGWVIPKVTDWGLAKVMLDSSSDEFKGFTPGYAAPEQLDPSNQMPIDDKTDIYQLGVVLYELLTGQSPFDESRIGKKKEKLTEEPTPPSEIADIPEEIDPVVLKALSGSRAARHETVVYLRDELSGLFEIYASPSRPQSSGSSVSKGPNLNSTIGEYNDELNADTAGDPLTAKPTSGDEGTPSGDEAVESEIDDTAGQQTTDNPSWDQYKHELDRKQRNFWYSILPGALKRVAYQDLVTEIEEAEARRESVADEFEAVKNEALEIQQFLREKLHASRRQGEPLPDKIDVSKRVERIKDIRARFDSFLQNQSQYLRSDEQTRITELQARVGQLGEYLKAKQKLDREIEEIGSTLEEFTARVDETLEEDSLLTEETEQNLITKLDDVSRWLRTARAELRTDALAEEDLKRFDQLIEKERSLRDRIQQHNPDIVQRQYADQIEKIESVHEATTEEVRPLRADGGTLPKARDEYLTPIENGIGSIDSLLHGRQVEYLSASQQDALQNYREDLESNREFIKIKTAFERDLRHLREGVDKLESNAAETLDLQSYLTSAECDDLQSQVDTVEERVSRIDEKITVSDLASGDQRRFERLKTALKATRAAIIHHNEQFLQQERTRFTDTFSGLTSENFSLNRDQQTAVFRNDIHNQVVAGPGTGKTFSLACRIKYLLEKGVRSDEILALAFSKNAAIQMETRIKKLFGITDVRVETLHAIGRNIINTVYPTHVTIVGESRLREVGRALTQLETTDTAAATHLTRFRELHREQNLETDEKKRDDMYESLRYNATKTLRGETIESTHTEIQAVHSEIADTLLKYDVDYQYQQYAPWADPADNEAYVPDFTLPEYDVYFEYRPSQTIRQQRKPWNQKRTEEQLQAIYQGTDKQLIDLPSGLDGDAIANIVENVLSKLGVTRQPRTGDELRDAAYEHNILQRDVENVFAEFVKKAKTNQVNPQNELAALDEDADPILYHFSHAAAKVLDIYLRQYSNYNAFDYVDMILRAKETVANGKAGDEIDYLHLLVDEFQDLNQAQVDFVRQLLSHGGETRLFAVGDDWQSVYGFKGARPEYFVSFDEYFSPSTRSDLTINYRCPPAVIQASDELIKQNEVAISKSLRAASDVKMTPTVHAVPGTNDYQYERNAIKHAVGLIKEAIDDAGRSPGEILVLARNDKGSPFIRGVSKQLSNSGIPVDTSGGSDGVRVTTAHDSKGSEAEHVIIMNAVQDEEDGFPSKDVERSLTQIVEETTESTVAEERRLFYVALTRSKERLDIQTRVNARSQFINEINGHINHHNVLVDCDEQRISADLSVSDARRSDPSWQTRQIGTLRSKQGYKLKFMIPDAAEEMSLLTEGNTYHFEDIELSEYQGQPQFCIDSETEITPL